MKRNYSAYSLIGLILGCFVTPAAAVTINFEGIADFVPVGSTYSGLGLVLTNATAITSGLSLNELEFPPHSGKNVAVDDGGAITGVFSTPVNQLSFFGTYAQAISLFAYNSGGTQVAVAVSLFSVNTVSSGNAPNQLFQINYAPGISSFKIEGSPLGGSFVIDDLTFTQVTNPGVPDTNSVSLLGFASLVVGLCIFADRRAREKRALV